MFFLFEEAEVSKAQKCDEMSKSKDILVSKHNK